MGKVALRKKSCIFATNILCEFRNIRMGSLGYRCHSCRIVLVEFELSLLAGMDPHLGDGRVKNALYRKVKCLLHIRFPLTFCNTMCFD